VAGMAASDRHDQNTRTGMTSDTSRTGTTGTSGASRTGASDTEMSKTGRTAGPHSSDMLNKADPRVDSDRDGRDGFGGRSGTSATGGMAGSRGAGEYEGSGYTPATDSRPISDTARSDELGGINRGTGTGTGTSGHRSGTGIGSGTTGSDRGTTGTTSIGSTGYDRGTTGTTGYDRGTGTGTGSGAYSSTSTAREGSTAVNTAGPYDKEHHQHESGFKSSIGLHDTSATGVSHEGVVGGDGTGHPTGTGDMRHPGPHQAGIGHDSDVTNATTGKGAFKQMIGKAESALGMKGRGQAMQEEGSVEKQIAHERST